jgi:hypothetical protein
VDCQLRIIPESQNGGLFEDTPAHSFHRLMEGFLEF